MCKNLEKLRLGILRSLENSFIENDKYRFIFILLELKTKVTVSIFLIILCVSLFNLHISYATDQNLVKNGDFSQGLRYWNPVKAIPEGTFPEFTAEEGHLKIDVWKGTLGYVEQNISLPQSAKITLSLRVWSLREDVGAWVLFNTTHGNLYDLELGGWYDDRFSGFVPEIKSELGATPFTRTYDITKFAGQTVTLMLVGMGLGKPSGNDVFFSDVQIKAVQNRTSIITLGIDSATRKSQHTAVLTYGSSIGVSGQIFPNPPATTVRIDYNGLSGTKAHNVRSNDLGQFSDSFVPDSTGVWTATASWDGNASNDPDSSSPVSFVVNNGKYQLDFLTAEINGKQSSSLTIQARTNETLNGWVEVKSSDSYRGASLVACGINNWELNKWDLIFYEFGAGGNLEQIGFKSVNQTWPVQKETFITTNNTDGLYNVIEKWYFPQEATTINEYDLNTGKFIASNHPSFITSAKNGTYYIVLMQSEVNTVDRVLYDWNNAFKDYLGKSSLSIWDFTPSDWESLFSRQSDLKNVIIFKVIVVDVDPIFNKVKSELPSLSGLLNDTVEEEMIQEAETCYSKRNFSQAKQLAVTINNYLIGNVTKQVDKAEEMSKKLYANTVIKISDSDKLLINQAIYFARDGLKRNDLKDCLTQTNAIKRYMIDKVLSHANEQILFVKSNIIPDKTLVNDYLTRADSIVNCSKNYYLENNYNQSFIKAFESLIPINEATEVENTFVVNYLNNINEDLQQKGDIYKDIMTQKNTINEAIKIQSDGEPKQAYTLGLGVEVWLSKNDSLYDSRLYLIPLGMIVAYFVWGILIYQKVTGIFSLIASFILSTITFGWFITPLNNAINPYRFLTDVISILIIGLFIGTFFVYLINKKYFTEHFSSYMNKIKYFLKKRKNDANPDTSEQSNIPE